MKIILSDIHLTESTYSTQVRLHRLFDFLFKTAEEVERIESNEFDIILLGDIFEFLRSDEWIKHDVRPWEACTESHIKTVTDIFSKIVSNNNLFFQHFKELANKFPFLKIFYIPGNHDRVINQKMGIAAKAELLKKIPIQLDSDGSFYSEYIDDNVGIIAKHGHEWDPLNRYTPKGAAFGDAIVIDFLIKLPIIVGKEVGIPYNDPTLKFLYDIDNVRPHHPRILAKWILKGLDSLNLQHPSSEKAIQKSFLTIADSLNSLLNSNYFEKTNIAQWWVNFLYFVAKPVFKFFGFIKTALRIPSFKEDLTPYHFHAIEDLSLSVASDNEIKYVIYGHTHTPEIVPLQFIRRVIIKSCV